MPLITTITTANTLSQMVLKLNQAVGELNSRLSQVHSANGLFTAVTTLALVANTSVHAKASLRLGAQTIANSATIWTSANDGTGSGLDADMLDGFGSGSFVANTYLTGSVILTRLLTADGAGSGLDADLLDGQNSTYFVANTYLQAQLALLTTLTNPIFYQSANVYGTSPKMRMIESGAGSNAKVWRVQAASEVLTHSLLNDAGTVANAWITVTRSGKNITAVDLATGGGALTKAGSTIWCAANDGAGSGLDADLLDGLNSTAFVANTYLQTTLGSYLPLAGGVITGNTHITKASPALYLNGASGARSVMYSANSSIRWQTQVDSALNFYVSAYNNSGAFRQNALGINRLTSVATFANTVVAVAYDTPSDERLKEQIRDPDWNLEHAIDQVEVRSYVLKADESKRERVGVIAQQVKCVFPEAVSVDATGFYTVDYSMLTMLALAGIQSLTRRVIQLEGRCG